MVEAILLDTKRVLPCCAYLTGEYGLNDLYCGVPLKLGKNGVEEIIELNLSDSSLSALQTSANAVKELCEKLYTTLKS